MVMSYHCAICYHTLRTATAGMMNIVQFTNVNKFAISIVLNCRGIKRTQCNVYVIQLRVEALLCKACVTGLVMVQGLLQSTVC